MMTLNINLLSDLVTWAAVKQEFIDDANAAAQRFAAWPGWDQTSWGRELKGETPESCGTSYCMAGQAAAQAGFVMVGGRPHRENEIVYDYCVPLNDKDNPEVEPRSISDVGRETLGLSDREAGYLFDGDNDLKSIVTIAGWIANKHGEVLDIPEDVAALDEGMYGVSDEVTQHYEEEGHWPWQSHLCDCASYAEAGN